MSKKVALLIGVSDYEPGLKSLPNAVKDVEAMKRVLQHSEIGEFAETDIKTLLNPDPMTMQQAIEMLFSDRQNDDLVVLYFSGHGVKDDSGRLYLATSRTIKSQRGELIRSTAVPSNFIHDIMSNSRSKREVVILDCCFSGAFAEGLSAKDDGRVNIRTQFGGEGRAILASSSSTQYSFEEQGTDLSIYTRYLLEGLETGAADRNGDGLITIDELHEYAKRKVQEAAPAMKPEIYAIKEGFRIKLAKAPIGDPKLTYQKEVERYASRGDISSIGRQILNALQENLKLSGEEAQEIEAKVLKPYQERQKKLQQYEQTLTDEIQRQYPFSEETRQELLRYQEILGLRNEDVEPIETRIVSEKQVVQSPEIAGSIEDQTISPRENATPVESSNIASAATEDVAPVKSENTASSAIEDVDTPSVPSRRNNKLLIGSGIAAVVLILFPLILVKPSPNKPKESPTSIASSTLSTNQKTAEDLYSKGRNKAENGYHEDAIKYYDQAIRLDPNYNNGVVFLRRADSNYELGRWDKAIKDYSEYTDRNPNNAEAFDRRAQVHTDKGEENEAKTYYWRAAELYKKDQRKTKKYQEAINKINQLKQSASSPPSKQCGVITPTGNGTIARLFSQPSRDFDTGRRINRNVKVSLTGQPKSDFTPVKLHDGTQGWVFNNQIKPCQQ